MRRGQLQSLEPVMVVIILAIIGIVGGMFYFSIAERGAQEDALLLDEQEDLAVLKRIAAAPELACPADITTGTYCIDLYKARAFSDLMAQDRHRVRYHPFFGDTQITVEWLDLPSRQSLALYNGTNATDLRATRTYFVVYDPVDGRRHFATLLIRRAS